MATLEDLDRLRAIIKQLTPLAGAQTGQLIRAEDWNTAIAALQSLARAVVSDQDAPVPPHEHPDQVGVGWLDPRLRQLVEQGTVGDPSALARVAALERGTERLQQTLDTLEAALEDLRVRSRDIATRDLDRQAAVNVVRRKLEGVADARDDVAQVRTSLAAVQDRVARAVELAENLQDGGQPVDLGGMARRVDQLTALRDGLTLPSGEVLDAQAFERKLAELRNELVTHDNLYDAIKDVTPELTPEREQALKAALVEDLKPELDKRDDAVRARVAEQVDARLATVREQVDKAVADARPGVIDAALGESRKELDNRAPSILASAGQDADARVTASASMLRQDLTALVDGLRGELSARVAAELDARLPGRLAEVDGRIDEVAKTVDTLVRDLEAMANRVGGTEARTEELARSLSEGLDKVDDQVKSLIARSEERTSGRLTNIEERLRRLEGRIGVLDTQLDPRIQTILDARDTQLREELAGIAGDQVAGLQDRMGVIVDERVGRAEDARVRLIATEAVEERLGLR